MDNKIDDIRNRIDKVDSSILDLLAKRSKLVSDMKKAKQSSRIFRPVREIEILRRVTSQNKTEFSDDAIRAIFTEIVSAGRNLQEPLRVAYLGPVGSFSHDAAIKMLGSQSDFSACDSLSAAVRHTEMDIADVALLPIENSSEGSVIESLKLLRQTSLNIIGEVDLPIVHCLLSNSEDKKYIKKVYAHSQALGQCREWLKKHLPQALAVPVKSNSEAAMLASKEPGAAAIASERASMIYKLNIYAKAIQDTTNNHTRFIALSKVTTGPTGNDKTSIICLTEDNPGSLHEVLGIFRKYGINLTCLVSHPEPNGSYSFYIDFIGHKDESATAKMLDELAHVARNCEIIGSYPRSI